MIYTVTLNPAIDLIVNSELNLGELNRANSEEYFIGGKGIQVSEMVRELGEETVATGFAAGFTGDFLKQELDRKGIPHHFVGAEGITRVNVKVLSAEGPMTELNLTGIRVNKARMNELNRYLENHITPEDVVVLSGNSAEGVSLDDFIDLCRTVSEKTEKLVVDASLEKITASLPFKPWLVRPSVFELYDAGSRRLSYEDDMTEAGKRLCAQGAKNVLIRDVAKATILVSEDGVYFGDPMDVPVVSSIGAMDALVSGFIVKYKETHDYAKALEWAIAAATATSATYDLATKKEIEEMLDEVYVTPAGGTKR